MFTIQVGIVEGNSRENQSYRPDQCRSSEDDSISDVVYVPDRDDDGHSSVQRDEEHTQ